MSLHFEINGNPELPVLFCVHGLLGGPENFRAMMPAWENRFCMVIVDLHSHMRTGGLLQIDEASLSDLHYDGAAEQILTFLDREFPGRPCYFAGLSLGGKIAYEFAGRAPERFRGAVVTDVGPGLLSDSTLYQFVAKTIPSLEMSLPWPELKQQLQEKVPDRNVRVMLQTQIHYPVKDGPAQWRGGMTGLKDLLEKQSISDQWPAVQSFAQYLVDNDQGDRNPRFIVYKASSLSAISDSQLQRMRALPFLEIRPVTGTSHFFHVTHRKFIEDTVLQLLADDDGESTEWAERPRRGEESRW